MWRCDILSGGEFVERVIGFYDVVGVAREQTQHEHGDVIDDHVRPIDGVIRVSVCPISAVLEPA